MEFNLDPKLVVGAALAFPVIYELARWDFSPYILILTGILGWLYMDSNMIDKSKVEKKAVPALGPPQPFIIGEKQYSIAPDGTPIPPTYQPPQNYPYYPPQR